MAFAFSICSRFVIFQMRDTTWILITSIFASILDVVFKLSPGPRDKVIWNAICGSTCWSNMPAAERKRRMFHMFAGPDAIKLRAQNQVLGLWAEYGAIFWLAIIVGHMGLAPQPGQDPPSGGDIAANAIIQFLSDGITNVFIVRQEMFFDIDIYPESWRMLKHNSYKVFLVASMITGFYTCYNFCWQSYCAMRYTPGGDTIWSYC